LKNSFCGLIKKPITAKILDESIAIPKIMMYTMCGKNADNGKNIRWGLSWRSAETDI
jgi:hypothetical protein